MLKIHMKQNINFKLTKTKSIGLKHLNDYKTFIEYSNDLNGIYKNVEEYNVKRNVK